MANSNDAQIVSSADNYFYTNGGTETLRLTAGNGIFDNNLTISGTLQNPNHIGVSNIAYNDVSLGEKLILWGRAQSNYYGLGITGGTIYSTEIVEEQCH